MNEKLGAFVDAGVVVEDDAGGAANENLGFSSPVLGAVVAVVGVLPKTDFGASVDAVAVDVVPNTRVELLAPPAPPPEPAPPKTLVAPDPPKTLVPVAPGFANALGPPNAVAPPAVPNALVPVPKAEVDPKAEGVPNALTPKVDLGADDVLG